MTNEKKICEYTEIESRGKYQQKSNLALIHFNLQQSEPYNFTIKTNMKYTRKHFGTWLKGKIYTKKLQSILLS